MQSLVLQSSFLFLVVTSLQSGTVFLYHTNWFIQRGVPDGKSTSCYAKRMLLYFEARSKISTKSISKPGTLSYTLLSPSSVIASAYAVGLVIPSFWQTTSLGPPFRYDGFLPQSHYTDSSRIWSVFGQCFFLCRHLDSCQPKLTCDCEVDGQHERIHQYCTPFLSIPSSSVNHSDRTMLKRKINC